MNLLKEFIQYLELAKNKLSKATLKNYSADIKRFVLWFEAEFGKAFNPHDVTAQVVDIYKKSSLEEKKTSRYKKLSPRSLERHLSSLNHFFKFLKRQNIISKNPFEEMNFSLKKDSIQDRWYFSEFKNYLYQERASPLTTKNYIVDIRQLLSWAEKEKGITKDTLRNIAQVLLSEYKYYLLTPIQLGGMGLTPATVNRKLSSLRKYFAFLRKQNIIDTNLSEAIQNEHTISLKRSFNNFNNNQPFYEEPKVIQNAVSEYSRFPPKRLFQKTSDALIFLFDNIITIPFANIAGYGKDILWTLKGKPIFKEVSSASLKGQKTKNFYFPLHKKIMQYLKYTRPKWYKKYHSYSIVDYLHFAILAAVMSGIGIAGYNEFFYQSPDTDILSANADSTRVLSLKGRLTDSFDNPITSNNTPLRVGIYNDPIATDSALLWQEVISANPDKDGLFKAIIGKNTPLPQALFFLHPSLWLGISIGQEPELVPRQEIATISYTTNSQTLQGLLPITDSSSGTKNVVLNLDSSGNLIIGENASPVFQATGGKFTLSGNVLLLTSVAGSNGNVLINPDGLGTIDLQKPLQNTSNNNNISTAIGALEVNDLFAILATSSGQSAFTINQDSTGPIISASTSGTAKFTVENSGNIVSGVGASWRPSSDSLNALNIASASGMPFITFDTIELNTGIGNAKPEKTLDVLGSFRATGEISFSNLKLNGGILYATESGLLSQIDPGEDTDCLFGGENPEFKTCPFAGFTDLLSIQNNRLGVGTASPLFKLDIQDNRDSTAAAQIFNTGSNEDADGLIIKLGNNTGSVASSNSFISFETSGVGIVGSIRGDADKGIEYKTSGIADFAEYIKKDKNQTIEYGSVVCIDEKGFAVLCDNNNSKIIGVASKHGGFTGGKDLGENSIRVGFVGQVYTRVSDANGEIKSGDPLTSSNIPGVAVKATRAGQIIGKALESLSDLQGDTLQSQIPAYVNLGWYDPSAYLTSAGEIKLEREDQSDLADLAIGPYVLKDPFGKTIENVSMFKESIIANLNAGFLNAQEITTNSLTIATESVTVAGKNLKDYVKEIVTEAVAQQAIISPIAEIDHVRTNIISPLAGDSLKIQLGTESGQLIVEDASGSTVAKIDSSGNASFSATLTIKDLYADKDATIGGTLKAGKIIADSIEGLEAKVSTLAANYIQGTENSSENSEYSESQNVKESDVLNVGNSDSSGSQNLLDGSLNASFGTFTNGLMSFGPTSLAETSIAGTLYIDDSLTLEGNSINVLGADLEIQSLKQGGISFLSGLIYIDKDGNLNVEGEADFAKDVSIGGSLATKIISPIPDSDLVIRLGQPLNQEEKENSSSSIIHDSSFIIQDSTGSAILSINQLGDLVASGSGTFNKLNLNLVKPALAISNTEAIATGSAGIAAIKPLQTELTIKNNIVTDESLIYITPVGTPSAQMPFLIRQTPEKPSLDGIEGSFTVGIQSPNAQENLFNWLIVN